MPRNKGSAAVRKRTPRSADDSSCVPPLDERLIPLHPTRRQRAELRQVVAEPLADARVALDDAFTGLACSDPESAVAALHALHEAAAAGLHAARRALARHQ